MECRPAACGQVDRLEQVAPGPPVVALEEAQRAPVGEHEQPHVGVEVGGQVGGPDVGDEVAGVRDGEVGGEPGPVQGGRLAQRRHPPVAAVVGNRGQHGQGLVGGTDVALVDREQRPVHQHGGGVLLRGRELADRPSHRRPGPGQDEPQAVGEQDPLDEVDVAGRRRELEGLGGLALLEEPLRGHHPQRGDLAGVAPPQGRCEVGAQQGVVPEPGAAAVQRHDEGVALGEVVEHRGRVVAPGEPGREVDGQVLDDAGAQQEVDDVVGQPHQHLAGQVVGHRPVGAAELGHERGRVAVLERQRRHPHPGRPALDEGVQHPP